MVCANGYPAGKTKMLWVDVLGVSGYLDFEHILFIVICALVTPSSLLSIANPFSTHPTYFL